MKYWSISKTLTTIVRGLDPKTVEADIKRSIILGLVIITVIAVSSAISDALYFRSELCKVFYILTQPVLWGISTFVMLLSLFSIKGTMG